MLHIKLTRAVKATDPTDPLPREFYGWDERRTLQENWDANRGYWALGARADLQDYVLLSYNETGEVVMAAKIRTIVDAEGKPNRRIIEGDLLAEGHPVHDTYVGHRAPEKSLSARNPITYIDDNTPGFGRPCLCGCGTEIHGALFVPGHDQAALHQRIAKIGSIANFLEWFDKTTNTEANFDTNAPTVLRGVGRIDLTVYPDGRIDLKFDPTKPGTPLTE
ncbi:hypothetical protein [Rhodococcus sp. USK13]|uniref:hypothetical protein n=1 Tax=Rhodococcus sp. USK13 TaxID=2806442 RepID=UPI001BCD1929|nr:hypothetical protein [Rhodococcus sp. USK13]